MKGPKKKAKSGRRAGWSTSLQDTMKGTEFHLKRGRMVVSREEKRQNYVREVLTTQNPSTTTQTIGYCLLHFIAIELSS